MDVGQSLRSIFLPGFQIKWDNLPAVLACHFMLLDTLIDFLGDIIQHTAQLCHFRGVELLIINPLIIFLAANVFGLIQSQEILIEQIITHAGGEVLLELHPFRS